jgi:hypothetical protein
MLYGTLVTYHYSAPVSRSAGMHASRGFQAISTKSEEARCSSQKFFYRVEEFFLPAIIRAMLTVALYDRWINISAMSYGTLGSHAIDLRLMSIRTNSQPRMLRFQRDQRNSKRCKKSKATLRNERRLSRPRFSCVFPTIDD